ncbi:hypothetical protein NKR19_g2559 [Coniochaeta hoffmannii]|uniref:GPI anchored serine-rich protein n=1 Tax=Coniochaeta hoffmannii TaxID=91930 RepID=A0AA38SIE4_9PEZI|nr:hypothetical protein NKR19_g2559 [Coniochaeta hoffmannii]
MRFATVAAFASAAMAHGGSIQSTVWSTEYHTITSCGPTVTDCPASSTVIKTSSYPLTTSTVYTTTVKTVTSCAPEVTNCPAHSTVLVTETKPLYTTVCPVTESASSTKYSNGTQSATKPASSPIYSTGALTTKTSAAACPTYSVKTISTSVTTVVPTVIYETVSIPCPTTASPSSGFPVPSSNGTVTKPPVATVTAGASTMGNSLFVVAAAGLAAVVFA